MNENIEEALTVAFCIFLSVLGIGLALLVCAWLASQLFPTHLA